MARRCSVFGAVPRSGRWDTALLVDGNIGIGGGPVPLLRRVAELLAPGGQGLVEVEGPAGTSERTRLRLASVGRLSGRSRGPGWRCATRTVSPLWSGFASTRPGRRRADGSSRYTALDPTGSRARGSTAGSFPTDLLAEPVTRAVADRRVRLSFCWSGSRSCSSPGCSPTPHTTLAWRRQRPDTGKGTARHLLVQLADRPGVALSRGHRRPCAAGSDAAAGRAGKAVVGHPEAVRLAGGRVRPPRHWNG